MRPLIRSFIGTAGYVDQEQVKTIESLFRRRDLARPKFGIFADAKTFRGQPSGHLTRNPSTTKLGELFTARRGNLNIVHYDVEQSTRFADELQTVYQQHDRSFDGFQLSIPWPDLRQLAETRRAHSVAEQGYDQMIIGMVIGAEATSDFITQPAKLHNQLMRYARLVDYVVLDCCHDPDRERRTALMHNLLRDLYSLSDCFRFVVNVDFNPELPQSIKALLQAFPNLSIEASQALCYEDSERFSIETAKRFVNRAINLYQSVSV